MSENYFKIFTDPEDHDKWSKQWEYALVREDIDDITRKQFKDALMVLEDILGKHFLKASHPHNPVRLMITEKTLFCVHETIQFATTLKALQQADFDLVELRRVLGSKIDARREGIPFVKIANAYSQQGFEVSFPVPPSRQGSAKKEKSPDIKVFDPETGEVFFIEVTTLNDGKDRIKEKDNSYFFHSQFHYIPPQHSFVGKQHISVTKEEYPEIEKIIANAKQVVVETQELVHYSDSRFSFILVSKDQEEWLKEFCRENNLRFNTIDGLPVNFDETKKIIRKIDDEVSQIPSNHNGLIYFPVSPIFLMFVNPENIISSVENHIKRFKNILGVVIYSKIIQNDKEESVEYYGRHIFRTTTIINLCTQSLYIHNNEADIYISQKTLDKINKTF